MYNPDLSEIIHVKIREKLLIIICSHELNTLWIDNIKILDNYMKLQNFDVDYCGISNQDDFDNYKDIINFKYKIINNKQQFSKICDFITDYKSELNYVWYIKIRPDIKLLENINFSVLSENAINARARVYYGPQQIIYGISVNGKGCWEEINDCYYDNHEHDIILDDMLFIFHNNIILKNAFNKIDIPDYIIQSEWVQTITFNARWINLNVIGINLENTKYNAFSGNINININ